MRPETQQARLGPGSLRSGNPNGKKTMSMMKERWLEIAFQGGRKMRFQFPIQATDDSMAARIEEALKLPSVSLCADEVLYVIPTNAIELMTISPAPKKLPRTVIRSAKLSA
jgi:hypothetical protein